MMQNDFNLGQEMSKMVQNVHKTRQNELFYQDAQFQAQSGFTGNPIRNSSGGNKSCVESQSCVENSKTQTDVLDVLLSAVADLQEKVHVLSQNQQSYWAAQCMQEQVVLKRLENLELAVDGLNRWSHESSQRWQNLYAQQIDQPQGFASTSEDIKGIHGRLDMFNNAVGQSFKVLHDLIVGNFEAQNMHINTRVNEVLMNLDGICKNIAANESHNRTVLSELDHMRQKVAALASAYEESKKVQDMLSQHVAKFTSRFNDLQTVCNGVSKNMIDLHGFLTLPRVFPEPVDKADWQGVIDSNVQQVLAEQAMMNGGVDE